MEVANTVGESSIITSSKEWISRKVNLSVIDVSSYKDDYRPEKVLQNLPSDMNSRWSADFSSASSHYIIFKLDRPAVLDKIFFGKFEKAHTSTLRRCRISAGLQLSTLTELTTGELNYRNTTGETLTLKKEFCLQAASFSERANSSTPSHDADPKNGTSPPSCCYLPSLYLKIEPLATPALCHDYFSLWYVEVYGNDDDSIVQPAIAQLKQYQETHIYRLVLKFFREMQLQDAYNVLCKSTGVTLEAAELTQLFTLLVEHGSYEATERAIEQAAKNGLFDEFVAAQTYDCRWTQIKNLNNNNDAVAYVPGRPLKKGGSWPSPRGGHAMCIDVVRRCFYIFGGWDGKQDLADFWSYNLDTGMWRCISTDTMAEGGPCARSCHRMVFDTRRQMIYVLGRFVDVRLVFGGHGPNCLMPNATAATASTQPGFVNAHNDFFAYDVQRSEWRQTSASTQAQNGPRLIFDHAMCIDEERGVIYIFGGNIVQLRRTMDSYHVRLAGLSGMYAYNIKTSTWNVLQKDATDTLLQTDIPDVRMTSAQATAIFGAQQNGSHVMNEEAMNLLLNPPLQHQHQDDVDAAPEGAAAAAGDPVGQLVLQILMEPSASGGGSAAGGGGGSNSGGNGSGGVAAALVHAQPQQFEEDAPYNHAAADDYIAALMDGDDGGYHHNDSAHVDDHGPVDYDPYEHDDDDDDENDDNDNDDDEDDDDDDDDDDNEDETNDVHMVIDHDHAHDHDDDDDDDDDDDSTVKDEDETADDEPPPLMPPDVVSAAASSSSSQNNAAENSDKNKPSDSKSPSPPSNRLLPVRVGHCMLFHPKLKVMYIFGGHCGANKLDDFITYDPVRNECVNHQSSSAFSSSSPLLPISSNSKSVLPSPSPMPTSWMQRAVLNADRDEIYVHYGLGRDAATNICIANGAASVHASTALVQAVERTMQQQQQQHAAAAGSSTAYSNHNKRADGTSVNMNNSLWLYRINNSNSNGNDQPPGLQQQRGWSCFFSADAKRCGDGAEPCARYAHQLVYDSLRRRLYMFGGNPAFSDQRIKRLNDLWQATLVSYSREDIARKCVFRIRTLRFMQLLAKAQQQQQKSDPSALYSALHYLQTQLTRASLRARQAPTVLLQCRPAT